MTTCRYLNRHGNQCTAEAVDDQGEVLLCVRHLAAAIELVRRVAAENPAYAIAAGVIA